MKDITIDDAASAVPAGVSVVADFENASFDVAGVCGQEFLDVVTVDWTPAIAAEIFADRRQPSERPEVDPADLDGRLDTDGRRCHRSRRIEGGAHRNSLGTLRSATADISTETVLPPTSK